MKNKIYTSLLWIGLAFTTTISYAKPVHFKHTSASNKSSKLASRHSAVHKKHSIDLQFSSFSNNRKRSKLHFNHFANHNTRKSAKRFRSFPVRSAFLDQKYQNDSFLEPTGNNDRIHSLIVAHNKNDFIDNTADYNAEAPRHITSVHGTIYSSLSSASQKAGLSNELLLQLTNIFAWDVDFATNLHQGDQFTVVYEETRVDNYSTDSQIIAAEFVNQDRVLTAIRYKDREGNVNYFSPEGKPMRKAFLSTPVDFVRISSGFDSQRKHPILNRIRAHRGVDYAARTGTPVKSAGDGKVIFRGRKGGYGQVMIVKHGEHYETLYAHLSDFKKGLESGSLVKQGEVIGYVGQTGLATGPHLHYEFLVDGVHRNPETQNMAQSLPLRSGTMADFKTQTRPLLAQLYQAKARSLFAKNQYNYN